MRLGSIGSLGLAVAMCAAALSATGCSGHDLVACGTHEWTADHAEGATRRFTRTIDAALIRAPELIDATLRLDPMELRALTIEVPSTGSANQARWANGSVEIGRPGGGSRLVVGAFDELSLQAGGRATVVLTEMGRAHVAELLQRGDRRLEAFVDGQFDRLPAQVSLRVRFELVAHVGGGGAARALECVSLDGEGQAPVAPCRPSPCLNGGECTVAGRFAQCTCPSGYTGDRCEIPPASPCSPNPCQNGGACSAPDGVAQCACPAGFTGPRCETPIVDACDPNPCDNGGECTKQGSSFQCACPAGFTGPTCGNLISAGACEDSPCAHGGTCSALSDASGFQCVCRPPWVGGTCEVDCRLNRWDDNGKPNTPDPDDDGDGIPDALEAQCAGWRTPCETTYRCVNGGTCSVTNGVGACECPSGFTGARCEIAQGTGPGGSANVCDPNPCQNGGTCGAWNGTPVCQCPNGYEGRFCEREIVAPDPCDPSPCRNGGWCEASGDEAVCFCAGGYTGRFCQTAPANPCSPSPCEHGGLCVASGRTAQCVCPLGYEGSRCEYAPTSACRPNPCVNGGACLEDAGMTWCACPPGYEGDFCERPVTADGCSPNPCVNGGACVSQGGAPLCLCPPDYEGEFCETERDPGPGGGHTQCHPNPCLNGGDCHGYGEYLWCVCQPGYMGEWCQFEMDLGGGGGDCASDPCQNGSTCHMYEGEPWCSCQPGTSGRYCERNYDPCDPNPCGTGYCLNMDEGGYVCIYY